MIRKHIVFRFFPIWSLSFPPRLQSVLCCQMRASCGLVESLWRNFLVFDNHVCRAKSMCRQKLTVGGRGHVGGSLKWRHSAGWVSHCTFMVRTTVCCCLENQLVVCKHQGPICWKVGPVYPTFELSLGYLILVPDTVVNCWHYWLISAFVFEERRPEITKNVSCCSCCLNWLK